MTTKPPTPATEFRILLSYHYFPGDLASDLRRFFGTFTPEVFADSGAFSSVTQGVAIDVHDYAQWLLANKHVTAVYANLDVIGDGEASAKGTWENQRILEDEYGLAPLPVFHASEPWSALERLLEGGYRYIGLGGLVGRSRPAIMPWLVQCFRMAEGTAVFHGFGVTSWEPLVTLPWYSVDSSSWGSGYRYGIVKVFCDRRGKMVQVPMADKKAVYAERRLFRSYGFDPADFAEKDRYNRARTCHLSALSWKRAEEWVRRRHGPVHVPGGGKRPEGLRWYNADSGMHNLADGAAGLRLYLADTNINDLAAGSGHSATTLKG